VRYNRNVTLVGNIVSYIDVYSTAGLVDNDYNIFNRGYFSESYSVGSHTDFLYPGTNEDKWNDPVFTGMFTDYNNGDFTSAAADSLPVGHGDPNNSTGEDILGYTRDASPDAGCYEYGAEGGGSLNAPSNLQLTALDYNKIRATWNDNSSSPNEDNFALERALYDVTDCPTGGENSCDWSLIASPAQDSTSYIDSSCSRRTRYHYRVKAHDNDAPDSNYCPEVNEITFDQYLLFGG